MKGKTNAGFAFSRGSLGGKKRSKTLQKCSCQRKQLNASITQRTIEQTVRSPCQINSGETKVEKQPERSAPAPHTCSV